MIWDFSLLILGLLGGVSYLIRFVNLVTLLGLRQHRPSILTTYILLDLRVFEIHLMHCNVYLLTLYFLSGIWHLHKSLLGGSLQKGLLFVDLPFTPLLWVVYWRTSRRRAQGCYQCLRNAYFHHAVFPQVRSTDNYVGKFIMIIIIIVIA